MPDTTTPEHLRQAFEAASQSLGKLSEGFHRAADSNWHDNQSTNTYFRLLATHEAFERIDRAVDLARRWYNQNGWELPTDDNSPELPPEPEPVTPITPQPETPVKPPEVELPGDESAPGQSFIVNPLSRAAVAYRRAIEEGRREDAKAIKHLATAPHGEWYTGPWRLDAIRLLLSQAGALGQQLMLTIYDIPDRDGEGPDAYSAGGAESTSQYERDMIDLFSVLGVAGVPTFAAIEPDALMQPAELTTRRISHLNATMRYASATPNVRGYLDCGHSNWRSAEEMAQRINRLHIPDNIGLAYNIANTQPLAKIFEFAEAINEATGREFHFIVDTGRNGAGFVTSDWCNVPNTKAGLPMSEETPHPLCDLVGPIKPPGESDGSMYGAPPAGDWYEAWALDFSRRSWGN